MGWSATVHRRDRGPGAQAAAAARDGALGEPTRLSNVVFMGMGEPLANYKRVVAALRRITDPAPDGLGISARGVTVSTVGLVPAIDKLAAERIPVTLAVSLHAPDDELRDTLVPVNNRWKVGEVLDAARRYATNAAAISSSRLPASLVLSIKAINASVVSARPDGNCSF